MTVLGFFRPEKNLADGAQFLVIKSWPGYSIGAMVVKAQPRRDSRAWRARRSNAEQLFAAGERQSAVARSLGLSRQCIYARQRMALRQLRAVLSPAVTAGAP